MYKKFEDLTYKEMRSICDDNYKPGYCAEFCPLGTNWKGEYVCMCKLNMSDAKNEIMSPTLWSMMRDAVMVEVE